MKLLIDIGNTRIKWAVAEDNTLILAEPLLHQGAMFRVSLLKAWWLLPATPTQILISCVSKAAVLDQVVECIHELWPSIDVVIPKAQASNLGVHNAYQEPEKLGIDRWLSLLAVRQLNLGAACVIDCGTAITVDFMDAQGRHLGGLISPGLTLMKQVLANNTEQLPMVDACFSLGLANHTAAAIDSGVLYAAAGLIEKVLGMQPEAFKVYLTGGDAALVSTALALAIEVHEDLVLRGLLALSSLDPVA